MTNNLERRYDVMSKQYDELLKMYNNILKAAKENADANEYCMQQLEAKVVALSEENDKLKSKLLDLNGEYLSLKVKYDKLKREV